MNTTGSGHERRDRLIAAAVATATMTAFPSLSSGWRRRIEPRRLALRVALDTVARFVALTLRPHALRHVERQEQARAELRERLGREPTAEELLAELGFASAAG